MRLRYRIEMPTTGGHRYRVHCHLPDALPSQQLRLPAWIPGSYLIRDFARHIISLEARDSAATECAVTKTDKSTWQVSHAGGPLDLTWEVYAHDTSVRGAYLDAHWGFFNGSSLFLEPVSRSVSCIEIDIPPHDPTWRLATALQPVAVDAHGFGCYEADDYEALIDSPVLMGPMTHHAFEVAGVAHHLWMLESPAGADTGRLAADLARICRWQAGLFGSLPMDRYHFLLRLAAQGYGGLEHRASSALLAQRKTLPLVGEASVSDDYAELLGLCSHEYFHSWHVKRIRPAPLAGADLSMEAYTRQLWVFEGITSYYDELTLLRAGCVGPEQYLGRLARTLTRLWRTPGRFQQSVAESSFDAWIKLYKADEATPNHTVSYYTKGGVIALCLDLLLRRESAGAQSLDDVMRMLWTRHGASNEPVPEGGFEALVDSLGHATVSRSLRSWVYDRDELPVAELLRDFGVTLRWASARDARDTGGYGEPPQQRRQCDPGFRVRAVDQGLRVEWLAPGGAAERAGIACGDILVAVDRQRIEGEALERLLRLEADGRTLMVHGFRDDRLIRHELRLDAAPPDTCWLQLDEQGRTGLKGGLNWLGDSGSD
ncbi:M61 family metallopeptidase [Candidatus Macondimonas diazotrophica]|jgi:predicted metalloprotease with PDZ domain|uniref:M61 family peptidase n=1 Tax=Candidatus Macondimonas diazotrophica TaxID=2305248 RepID=A0A4Z0F7Z9_9GAMM|nr:PDZ domain-containing protein [Candidatus Macondimonas diazotrophica]TFZ82457.1 M61 family peptidase [Candidatus Macondimonas diazotrophica]